MPQQFREELWEAVWGGRPDVDVFADGGNAMAPKWCARFPDGVHSHAEGLSTPLDTGERLWMFPPFSLVRPLVVRLLAGRPPNAIVVLPDRPIFRTALSAWRTYAPPATVLMPPDFRRAVAPSAPLLILISPAALR